MQAPIHNRIWAALAAVVAVAGGSGDAACATEHPALNPVVEVEEDLYRYEPASNGAGPMWCSGSTCLARSGEEVFASGLETLASAKPLNNCRWLLFHRSAAGWRQMEADPVGRTREPSPLAVFPGRDLFLSVNPTLVVDPTTYNGPARPELLQFGVAQREGGGQRLVPVWDGTPRFTEHSYRSFAADGRRRELILFQNIDYTHAEWAFRDRHGQWTARGQLRWPWGAEYDKPEPIRVCYPDVALDKCAVHFCGVSDVVEPYAAWRAYKKQLTGQEWDYDFRRLFYTWCPDIRTGRFKEWIEIASRDRTCGWISPGDLWVAPDGTAHIVWTDRALDERLRPKFFPDQKQSHALNYAVVRQGRVVLRRTLVLAEEGGSREVPSLGRFQITPDHRLILFYYVNGQDARGQSLSENRLMEIYPDGSNSPAIKVPLKRPFASCFTATVRAGSSPSRTLDLLGPPVGTSQTISYARIRL